MIKHNILKTQTVNVKDLVKKTLAEHLGLEVDDIKDEDSLSNDLHMGPTDLSALIEKLESERVDTTTISLTEIETVNDLIEALDQNGYTS